MERIERTFGLKLNGNCVPVEEKSMFGDSSKYDLMLTIGLKNVHNGNVSYIVAMNPLKNNSISINGWTIEEIHMPGNWYGQWLDFSLVDRYGVEFEYSSIQCFYEEARITMLSKSFSSLIDFCNSNYCVDTCKLKEDKSFVCTKQQSIGGLKNLFNSISSYLDKYMIVAQKLKEDGSDAAMECLTEINKDLKEKTEKILNINVNIDL